METQTTKETIWDGKRIREARDRKGITAKAAAVQLDITPEYLSRVENGFYDPSGTLVKRMATTYDVPLSFFLSSL